jgi:hypothetical protein
MGGNVITGRHETDIEKLADEIVASVHDCGQLRTVMARICANHDRQTLRDAAWCAMTTLTCEVQSAMDRFDNLQWAIGVELGPEAMGGMSVCSVNRDWFRMGLEGATPPPPPRSHLLEWW